MPEGPEVRRYADELASILVPKKIIDVTARTKSAKAWLHEHRSELIGKKVQTVIAHGKNIIGTIDGGYYFYSHQMMWGRWHMVAPKDALVLDKRERARIEVKNKVAILMSAPIFEVGFGDPYEQVKYLKNLGPNILSYNGSLFDQKEFQRRLETPENRQKTIGAALLDQSILAGIGNYLRAEILFIARMNPWLTVGRLTKKQKKHLCELIPEVSERAYKTHGVTVSDAVQERMRKDGTLVYVPGKEYGTHHYVFRRTNLPCLVCDEPVRQLRQILPAQNDDLDDESVSNAKNDEEEKSRIIYFCPNCQGVDFAALKASQPKMNSR
jgi:endonuclease-8